MKQYRKLFFLGFICAAWPVSYAQAQDVSAGVPDSLLTIGYTVGHTRNISSLVESFTGKQLKADQITNPLEAIYGKVPALPYSALPTVRPLWMPYACAALPR